MDEETLNAIAEYELAQDMRRAEEQAVRLGHMERGPNGRLILTDAGEDYFLERVLPQPTLH